MCGFTYETGAEGGPSKSVFSSCTNRSLPIFAGQF